MQNIHIKLYTHDGCARTCPRIRNLKRNGDLNFEFGYCNTFDL